MEGHTDMGERGESLNNVVLGGPREDQNESRPTGDNIDGNASRDKLNSLGVESSKKRKHSRPNSYQVQELEAFFKENPYPDEKARLELGKKLSMENKKLKFWFQNRRNQRKMKLDYEETGILKNENDKFRTENIARKEAMKNPICCQCGYRGIIRDINIDQYQTKVENVLLKNELERISVLAKKLLGPLASLEGSTISMMTNSDMEFVIGRNNTGVTNMVDTAPPMGLSFRNDLSSSLPVVSPHLTTRSINENVTYDKSKLMNLAFSAMNELLMLSKIDEPLWVRSLDGGGETLNLEEYARLFTQRTSMKPACFTIEATRASGIVINNSVTLVETLMDKSRWIDMFSCIIGKTSTFDVISSGIGGSRSDTLLLIQTEFQIISDLVPVREIKFLRFCHQHSKDIWVVVDVSIDTIQEDSPQCQTGTCRRLPSGCVLQDMPNGYCKVTWIEHMEYDENFIHHYYRPLVRFGLGFGAQRWIFNLQRESEFLTRMMSSVNAPNGHAVCPNFLKSIGMLAKRMTRTFCAGVCETTHKWETIQLANGEDAKLILRKRNGDPGEPIGVVLSATKTIWLPVKQHHLFEFFMNENSRNQWNVLSKSYPRQQMVYLFKGQNPDSSISLFHANMDETSANQKNVFILQDTWTDATGSLLVYSTIDSLEINAIMNGGDSSHVSLLPSGIAIVPDCFQDYSGDNNCNGTFGKKDNSCTGSLVTIGFQVLVNRSSTVMFSKESLKTVKDLVSHTIRDIKTALKCE